MKTFCISAAIVSTLALTVAGYAYAEPTATKGATVRLDNVEGSRVYAQLARPAREGRFPALVIYQWASPPYPLQKSWVTDRAAEGWLALNVEPHDVPGDMPQAFYDALPAIIKRYNTIGHHSRDEQRKRERAPEQPR